MTFIIKTESTHLIVTSLLLAGLNVGCISSPPNQQHLEDGLGAIQPVGTIGHVYSASSRFDELESSVSYSGQIARHVLIAELTSYIKGLDAQIDSTSPAPGSVSGAMNSYFLNDGDIRLEEPLSLSVGDADPAACGLGTLQTTLGDISSGKSLVGKLAGNDIADGATVSVTDYLDWNDGVSFAGWTDIAIAANGGSVDTPSGLVEAFFATIDTAAVARGEGLVELSPTGDELPTYVTRDGLDLSQLVQKFLLGAVAYAQGTDDYLDDGTAGKGLDSPNTQDGEKLFTKLEHAWDEGFGYFGAARDYGDYTDEEAAGKGGRDDYANGFFDSNDDCLIDLTREYNFGHSVNASKRDLGAVAVTDFSKQAFDAFAAGRQLIANAGDELTANERSELLAHRDVAVTAWENAIASTIVHYINEVLADLDKLSQEAEDYSFVDHAKHWSELKGFALGLQFNPRSRLPRADFAQLHVHIGDAPVIEGSTVRALESLLEA
ncbi:MAG: DUF4856 domain-containing protein, partial [Polyangiaceae bacterium]|nr:DUF4856 domain-containing protein [Polyangiaceae bacterium]